MGVGLYYLTDRTVMGKSAAEAKEDIHEHVLDPLIELEKKVEDKIRKVGGKNEDELVFDGVKTLSETK